jgi:hypothetical protein
MFEEFELKMKQIKDNYDTYRVLPTKFNKNLFNDVKNKKIDEITQFSSSEDIKSVHNLISSDNKLLKQIYLYQFLNPEICETKIENIEQLIIFVENTLKKFQWIVGGYLIEDNNWMLERKTSKRFRINENDIIFVNTLDYYDDDTEIFMNNLIK